MFGLTFEHNVKEKWNELDFDIRQNNNCKTFTKLDTR